MEILIEAKDDRYEFFPQVTLEPDTSLFIRECIDLIYPEQFEYVPDFFDTYESGHFIKNGLRIDVAWSIWIGFEFSTPRPCGTADLEEIVGWIKIIMRALQQKEVARKAK